MTRSRYAEGVDPLLADRIAVVVATFAEVSATWVFGSVARGEERPDSDIDVAVLPSGAGMTFDRQLTLAARLEAVTGRRVDLVVLGLRELVLCHEVLTLGCLVHEADRERRIDFVSDALVRASDFMPTWRLAHEGWMDGWRRSIQGLR